MSLGGFGRRDGAREFPEKLHVQVVYRPPHGEVVQLTRGQLVGFITGHPWTLPPGPLRLAAYPGLDFPGRVLAAQAAGYDRRDRADPGVRGQVVEQHRLTVRVG